MSREALGNFEFMVLLAVLRLGDGAYGVPIARTLEETAAAKSCSAAFMRHWSGWRARGWSPLRSATRRLSAADERRNTFD